MEDYLNIKASIADSEKVPVYNLQVYKNQEAPSILDVGELGRSPPGMETPTKPLLAVPGTFEQSP